MLRSGVNIREYHQLKAAMAKPDFDPEQWCRFFRVEPSCFNDLLKSMQEEDVEKTDPEKLPVAPKKDPGGKGQDVDTPTGAPAK